MKTVKASTEGHQGTGDRTVHSQGRTMAEYFLVRGKTRVKQNPLDSLCGKVLKESHSPGLIRQHIGKLRPGRNLGDGGKNRDIIRSTTWIYRVDLGSPGLEGFTYRGTEGGMLPGVSEEQHPVGFEERSLDFCCHNGLLAPGRWRRPGDFQYMVRPKPKPSIKVLVMKNRVKFTRREATPEVRGNGKQVQAS